MAVDFDRYLQLWEKQQNALIEKREERFSFMIDFLKYSSGDLKRILDLGCGPGSLSIRLSQSFPHAEIYGIDYDPVLLRIGKESTYGKRITFLERDLKSGTWIQGLPSEGFDAVVSTTALHWLPYSNLENVYIHVNSLLRPSGIFMNGDHFHSVFEDKTARIIYDQMRHLMEKSLLKEMGAMDWDQWWKYVEESGDFRDELAERNKRYSNGPHDQGIPLETHFEFLRKAGFNTADIPWKYLNNSVLVAIKE